MERENVGRHLKENLKGVRVETKRIIMGGLEILEPVIFLELKDDSEIRFFRLNLNLEKWED